MFFYSFKTENRQIAIRDELVKCGLKETNDIRKAKYVLLPFLNVQETFKIDDAFFNGIAKDTVFITGVYNADLNDEFKTRGYTLNTVLDNEEVKMFNAIPTAEGVLHKIIDLGERCIFNSKFLVIGYGVCGMETARKLNALGGIVHMIECDRHKINVGKLRGIKSIDEKDVYKNDYDFIINTVPEKVITDTTLKNLKSVTILDIASKPYGFDANTLIDLDVPYHILSSLPSKFGTKFSGEILGRYIYDTFC